MQNLAIKTKNKSNNNIKYKEKLGTITVFLGHTTDFITVSDFEESGETYKELEQSKILISDNDKVIWSGTKYEFFDKLKN